MRNSREVSQSFEILYLGLYIILDGQRQRFEDIIDRHSVTESLSSLGDYCRTHNGDQV